MNFQIIRLNNSEYANDSFYQKEARVLTSISGITYTRDASSYNSSSSYILITDNNTDITKLPLEIVENTVLIVHSDSYIDQETLSFIKQLEAPFILGTPIKSRAISEYSLSVLFNHYSPIRNQQYWNNHIGLERKLLRDQKCVIVGDGQASQEIYKVLKNLCNFVEILNDTESDSALNGIDVLIAMDPLAPSYKLNIGEQFLKKMNSDGLLINVAHESYIDEDHLKSFMKRNPFFHTFMDSFQTEPFIPGSFNDLKNFKKSSNLSGLFQRLTNDIISFEYLIISEFVSNYQSQNLARFYGEYKECIINQDNIAT